MTDGFYWPWAVLAREPWKKMPWELARLTRRQCVELYIRPAVERAKPAAPAVEQWNWDRDGVPPKDRFVSAAKQQWGMGEGEAAATWERLKAAEDQARG